MPFFSEFQSFPSFPHRSYPHFLLCKCFSIMLKIIFPFFLLILGHTLRGQLTVINKLTANRTETEPPNRCSLVFNRLLPLHRWHSGFTQPVKDTTTHTTPQQQHDTNKPSQIIHRWDPRPITRGWIHLLWKHKTFICLIRFVSALSL